MMIDDEGQDRKMVFIFLRSLQEEAAATLVHRLAWWFTENFYQRKAWGLVYGEVLLAFRMSGFLVFVFLEPLA